MGGVGFLELRFKVVCFLYEEGFVDYVWDGIEGVGYVGGSVWDVKGF